MKKLLFISAIVLTSVCANALVLDVAVYSDCSKNGYTKVFDPTGTASVYSSGRTSCEWVQLWEGGPKWATFNVGATITNYANLTAGTDATSGNVAYYNTANVGGLYAWNNPNLNGRKTTWVNNVSTGISDVATTLWGSNWQTPTKQQLDTLQNSSYGKTNWTWCDGSTTQYVTGCTLKGYKVSGVGDYAQYSIFLPAAGYFVYGYGTVGDAGSYGDYWSSTELDSNGAYNLDFGRVSRYMSTHYRQSGMSVRAVLDDDDIETPTNNVKLTLNATGCEAANVITCQQGYPVRVTAEPDYGYHFVQWSDGNTDNPRIIILTQDTIQTALFAKNTNGICGENLKWSYSKSTLHIIGTGEMSNYVADSIPWILYKDSITNIIIDQGVTSIGDNAFYGCSNNNFKTLLLPNSIKLIGDSAFANCAWLKTITMGTDLEEIGDYAFSNDSRLIYINCYATEPPLLGATSFANYNAYLKVPCEVKDEYVVALGWSSFSNISCISAEMVEVTEIQSEPTSTSVEIAWPAVSGSDNYTIEVKQGSKVICTIIFNAQGQLLSINFPTSAPARGIANAQEAVATATGWAYTINGLTPGTAYTYSVVAKNAVGSIIDTKNGSFETTSPTAIEEINDNRASSTDNRKLIKNGILLIERNGVYYNAQGAVVE